MTPADFIRATLITAPLLLAACGDGNGGVTLRGTITAAPSSAIDSDTNDSTSRQINNDTISTAQPLRNPVTVGGFVATRDNFNGCSGNVAGTDNSDIFRVELFADQVIQLTVADLGNADLDLYLANTDGEIIGSSVAANSNESVQIPEDGDYLVEVCAFSGASNYVMGVGQGRDGFATNSYNSQQEIITGEAVMVWEPGIDGSAILASHMPDVLPLGNGSDFSRLSLNAVPTKATSTRKFVSTEQAERHATLIQLKALNNLPGAMCAEPNFKRQALAIPNDPGYEFQWHYPLIELPSAWDTTTGDASVITAVIDTGVLLNHPDLQGQFDLNDTDGFDFIADPQVAADGNGRDGNANDPGDQSPGGSSFHGTHVAGTIAAAGNNNLGVAGVAYGSKIMPLRVLGVGGGSSFDTLQAVLYAAGLDNASGSTPPRRADVINLSLGGGGFSQAEQNAFTAARNAGVIIIAAAGNENTSQRSYPAAYSGVVSVAAVDQLRRRAPYSNFGSTIDVAAPGGDASRDRDGDGYGDGVLSTGGNDSSGSVRAVYPFEQGTSMAAPHVAGVAALMKSVHPALTPANFDALLANGDITDDIGLAGRDDDFGHGLINARKAVAAAINLAGGAPTPTTATLVASPGSLGFDSTQTELFLELQNSGDGALTVQNVSDNEDWLTITANDTDVSNGLGEYRVAVNRSGLADGSYQATITVTSSSNTLNIPVLLQVGAQVSDVGVQYVLLVNTRSNSIIEQQRIEVQNGQYPFTFTNIPDGEYEILSGTDSDEDNVICDAGEACGSFITLDQPVTITVTGENVSNINFVTGFEAQLNQAGASHAISKSGSQK